MRRRTPLLLGLALILLPGCINPARRLEVAAVKRITVDKTTRPEVEHLFGKPRESIAGPDGFTVVHYDFIKPIVREDSDPNYQLLHPGDVLFRTLSVLYDARGIAVQKLHDESLIPLRRSLTGWFELGPEIKNASAAKTVTRDHSVEELITQIGPPAERQLDIGGAVASSWVYCRFHNRVDGYTDLRKLLVSTDGTGLVKDYKVVELDRSEWFFLMVPSWPIEADLARGGTERHRDGFSIGGPRRRDGGP